TGEVVTLHHTGEALALARADDVDELAGFERAVDRDLLASRVVGGVGRADLGDLATRRHTGGLEVARGRLRDLARVDVARSDLNGAVAVLLGGADLRDDVRRELEHRDGNELAAFVPHMGHARPLGDTSLRHRGFY